MAGGDLGQGTRLAALTGAWICFEDEAGQSLRPGRARTWAPRGRTPVTRVSGNAGRLSVAGMACLKPGRPGRFSYRLRVHRRRKGSRASMSEADYAALVTAAHRALNAPVVLVWDNLSTHRSQKMRRFTEANSAQQHVADNAQRIDLPTTWLVGGDDPIADPAQSRRVADRVRNASYHDLAGMKHEVFNELDRAKVFAEVSRVLDRAII